MSTFAISVVVPSGAGSMGRISSRLLIPTSCERAMRVSSTVQGRQRANQGAFNEHSDKEPTRRLRERCRRGHTVLRGSLTHRVDPGALVRCQRSPLFQADTRLAFRFGRPLSPVIRKSTGSRNRSHRPRSGLVLGRRRAALNVVPGCAVLKVGPVPTRSTPEQAAAAPGEVRSTRGASFEPAARDGPPAYGLGAGIGTTR